MIDMTSTLISELTLLREAARRGADNSAELEAVTQAISAPARISRETPTITKEAKNG